VARNRRRCTCNHSSPAASCLDDMNIKLPRFILIAAVMLGGWPAAQAPRLPSRHEQCGCWYAARSLKHTHGNIAQELNLTSDHRQQLRPFSRRDTKG